MADTPIVAFNNKINKAVLTAGRSLGDLDAVSDYDTANSYLSRSDTSGNVVLQIKSLENSAQCAIFGSHRYDASGQTIDFSYNIEAHDGNSFSSVASGSFINQKESLFTNLSNHTLGLPSSTTNTTQTIFNAIFFTGNKFVAAGNGIYYSTDLVNWTQDLSAPAGVYNDVKGLDDALMAVGNGGLFAYFDGNSWATDSFTVSDLHCVATNASSFMIGGANNEIWKTNDLINFSQVTSPDVAGVTFIKCESIGLSYNICTASKSWTTHNEGTSFSILIAAGAGQSINDVKVYNNTLYVCGNGGIVFKSIDLETYDDISHLVGDPKCIAITNTEILTVGLDGDIKVSYNDGKNWSNYGVSTIAGNSYEIATNGIDFAILTASGVETLFIHYKYKITFSNMAALSDFIVAELFIGDYVEIGHVSYGVDPKSLRNGIKRFNSENGRIFENVLWRRLELSFSLRVIDSVRSANIKSFREYIYATRAPIWFVFKPDTDPYTTYLMRVKGDIDMIIQSPVHESTSIKFIEYV